MCGRTARLGARIAKSALLAVLLLFPAASAEAAPPEFTTDAYLLELQGEDYTLLAPVALDQTIARFPW